MTAADPWIKCYRPNASARVRLYCFPYAGGGASAFRAWHERLPADVEVRAVQLPGRENRLMEEAFSSVDAAVQVLADRLAPELAVPHAFFGHSMGALVAFELLRELERRGVGPAERFFASAHRAPQVPCPVPPIHELSDAEFLDEVDRRYDAVPEAARENEELLELFLPGLRADVAVCDTYAYDQAASLACPLSALGGESDPQVSRPDLDAWREQTRSEFDLTIFPGDHFFLQSAEEQVLAALSERLTRGGSA